MRSFVNRSISLAVCAGVAFTCAACGAPAASAPASVSASAPTGAAQTTAPVTLDPQNPTTVTVWNYYNGDQLAAFEELVAQFNTTVGAEQGIVVVSVSQSSVNNLADCLLDAVAGKAGAQKLPTLAGVYSETAYILDQSETLVDLDNYFTADELSAYIPNFIDEGRFNKDNALLLFPVTKSTEAFVVNTTDWATFEAACGISLDSIASNEELIAAAEQYYLWTDSLTPDVPEDGKALYGRDSIANYIFVGCVQLGHELFPIENGIVTTDLDRDTFKTLWDNYYIPFINGYFGAYATYRSEDAKTGSILSLTGSTTGISYIPTSVTLSDDTSHDINVRVMEPLPFANAVENVAVQQGAGYCMLKTDDKQQYAAAQFLKWFTDADRNLEFSIESSYSPVTIKANDKTAIQAAYTSDASPKSQNVLQSLELCADIFTTRKTYTCKPFAGSKEVRDVLGNALLDACVNDRAAVLEKMAGGMTRAEAVAEFSSDAYFDTWFDTLCTNVNNTVH